MKFDIKKLKQLNLAKGNIAIFKTPYSTFNNSGSGKNERKDVIFFGCDFKNLPPDVNIKEFIEITNKCLDFVRRECAGYKLCYRPHPAETDEFKSLNLDSFEIEGHKATGDFFLCKNLSRIKYVFSAFSGLSKLAYELGLNSFVFSNLFKKTMNETQTGYYEDYFKEMPPGFFINSFDQKLTDNKSTPGEDELFKKEIRNLVSSKNGAAWFVIVDPGLLHIIISIARLIKSIDPGRNTNLIISHHKRWDKNKINIEEIGPYFDTVRIFKATSCSLRPRKILDAVKTAFSARNLQISGEDIIFGFANTSFLENCLISYNKEAMKISCQMKLNLEWTYGGNMPELLSDDQFYQIKSSIFYNRILEPLLGLNRTLYLKYGDGTVFNISRYEKPLNDVYDKVYLFENSKLKNGKH